MGDRGDVCVANKINTHPRTQNAVRLFYFINYSNVFLFFLGELLSNVGNEK